MSRVLALAVTAIAAFTLLTGCGGGDSAAGGSAAGGSAAPTKLVPPKQTILSASSTKQLGTVVVDGSLRTLYRYDGDNAKPSATTCVDSCAENWPPVLVDGAPVLEGVSEAAVGTVVRPDGSKQLTLGGWPIYRHAADSAPGATDGNGIDGQWFAVKPNGAKAAAPA